MARFDPRCSATRSEVDNQFVLGPSVSYKVLYKCECRHDASVNVRSRRCKVDSLCLFWRKSFMMRLICFWCSVLALAAATQEDGFYAPQTFRNHDRGPVLFHPTARGRPWETSAIPPSLLLQPGAIESYQKGLFTPAAGRNDVTPQGSVNEPWRPVAEPSRQSWGGPAPVSEPILHKAEPWRAPFISKEQQANILHHKQALTSEGSFRFEYASDNGLAAGETIEPDGTRVGAYQYKDPSGQIVKLKYRAGKEGFQILEGSHLPKSPEPQAPPQSDNYYQQAYEQQRRQYELQQTYNQQRNEPQQTWTGGNQQQQQQQQGGGQKAAAAAQYYTNWRQGNEDDGQYRENEVESAANRGPHSFGEGYAFAFQG